MCNFWCRYWKSIEISALHTEVLHMTYDTVYMAECSNSFNRTMIRTTPLQWGLLIEPFEVDNNILLSGLYYAMITVEYIGSNSFVCSQSINSWKTFIANQLTSHVCRTAVHWSMTYKCYTFLKLCSQIAKMWPIPSNCDSSVHMVKIELLVYY